MLFYFSKFLWFFFNPFNLFIYTLFLSFILYKLKFNFISQILYFLSIFIFVVTAVLPTGSYLNYLLELNYVNLKLETREIDGILILAGASNPHLTKVHNQINVNDSAERLVESIHLINSFPEAKIIFSGGLGHSDVAKLFYKNMGVDINKIIFEDKSRNTYENILFSKKIINPKENQKWIIVTSAFHLKRSLAISKKLNWKFIPYPVDFRKSKKFKWKLSQSFNFLRNINEFKSSSHEWVGLISYKLLGRI